MGLKSQQGTGEKQEEAYWRYCSLFISLLLPLEGGISAFCFSFTSPLLVIFKFSFPANSCALPHWLQQFLRQLWEVNRSILGSYPTLFAQGTCVGHSACWLLALAFAPVPGEARGCLGLPGAAWGSGLPGTVDGRTPHTQACPEDFLEGAQVVLCRCEGCQMSAFRLSGALLKFMDEWIHWIGTRY